MELPCRCICCSGNDSIDFDDFKNSVATNYEEKFNNQTDDISSTLDDLDDEFTE
jgi:DNA-directed RNA polymerase subunit N (RpoN/RPB10)